MTFQLLAEISTTCFPLKAINCINISHNNDLEFVWSDFKVRSWEAKKYFSFLYFSVKARALVKGDFFPLQRWEVIIWRKEWKKYNYSVLISSFPHPSALYMCLSRSKEAKSVWMNTCEERKNSGSEVTESLSFNTFQLVPLSGKNALYLHGTFKVYAFLLSWHFMSPTRLAIVHFCNVLLICNHSMPATYIYL